MPLPSGTRLGPYEIVAPLGAGGMGEVYRAHDTRLRRDVAIKVLPETIAQGSAWERFEREARAASALNHPNICAVYDVGEADERQFLVMELLEGKTLRDYVGKEPAKPATASALAMQIADALEAAHEKGIIHRDIKPGNIMVTGREHVKVLDFGLAKYAPANTDETRTLDSLTAAGTVVGTPSYIAPEILQGKEADARSDIWALGVVLYEMLSGRLPFRGTTMFEVSSGILREDPPPLPSTVPSQLRAIVERCLEKDPSERYQNGATCALHSKTPPRLPRPVACDGCGSPASPHFLQPAFLCGSSSARQPADASPAPGRRRQQTGKPMRPSSWPCSSSASRTIFREPSSHWNARSH